MLRSVQVLRGLAAIGVVLYHMRLWEVKKLGAHIAPDCFAVGEAGVDLFFVISGFIMVFIQPEALTSTRAHLRFLIHRFTRVFPPLWLMLLALLPVYLVRPQLFNNYCHNQVDVVRSFLLLPQEFVPLLGVAWTLIHEVYFYLAVSLVLLLGPRGRWGACLGWFATVWIVFACFGESRFGNHRVLQLVFSPFSLTFLLGSFLGLGREWLRRVPVPLALGCLALGVVGLVTSVQWMPPFEVYPNNNHLFRFLGFGVPSFLLVGAAIALESQLPSWLVRLQYFGDRSYALYLVHLPIVSGIYTVGQRFGVRSAWLLLLLAGACFLGCLLAALLFHKVELKVTSAPRKALEGLLLSGPKQPSNASTLQPVGGVDRSPNLPL